MKTDTDYIREGVELADGWWFNSFNGKENVVHASWFMPVNLETDDVPRPWLDALAAQLVRQVVAAGFQILINYHDSGGCGISVTNRDDYLRHWNTLDGDGKEFEFSLNTIKAIVDSGVLNTEGEDNE